MFCIAAPVNANWKTRMACMPPAVVLRRPAGRTAILLQGTQNTQTYGGRTILSSGKAVRNILRIKKYIL